VNQESSFLLQIGALETAHQKILREKLELDPLLPFHDRQLSTSENRIVQFFAPPGPLTARYEVIVEVDPYLGSLEEAVEVPVSELPPETLPFLYPSRYCPSDRLLQVADDEFGSLEPGYSRVTAICNWLYEKIRYTRGVSDAHTTALETYLGREGVCRDFAHLGIMFCRALNLPARFVSVYAYGLAQPDFHACFEVFLGNRWYLFDATRLAPQTGFLRLGSGRDAAEVSFATVFGVAELEGMETFVEVVPNEEGKSIEPEWTVQPISIA
jgi:transglutaminase-like putative cysteine protease